MAVTATQGPLTGLPRRLVQDGVVSEADLMAALEAIGGKSSQLVPHLVANRLGDPRQIAIAAAHEFGVPLLDLDAVDLDLDVVKLVDEKLLLKHRILPMLQRGKRLYVAVCDPTNLQALDDVKFQTTLRIEPVVVEQDKLDARVARAIEAVDTTMSSFDDEGDFDLENLEVSAGDEEVGEAVSSQDVDDAPIVRFVNKVMLDAIKRGASDIHFEPYEKHFRIRLRQDGVLTEIARPPVALSMKVAARLKVMARLDIAERRIPQDGRIKMKLSKNRAIDFRVNTCPTLFGEKVVCRLLDPSSAQLGIDALGYEENQKKLYLENLAKPYGMILVTGPTGSGKTVSLYTGLNILNTADRNISTAEDPVEINMAGHQPGQRESEGRAHVRRGAARVPAPRPRRHHGRRDPRPRNGGDRDQGGANRSPRAVDAAHERRAEDAHASRRHGRQAVRDRELGQPDHRAASRARALHATARSRSTSRRRRC